MINVDTITCHIQNDEILYVSWLDYDPFMKLNFEGYFFTIIEQINRTKIKKLVLDCSCRQHDPSEEDFIEIFELFLSGLSTTGLEKMARICPPNPVVSIRTSKLLEILKVELNLSFELRNFKEPKSALVWMKKDNLKTTSKSRQAI